MLHDRRDPTVALFTSSQGAARIGRSILRMYPKTVDVLEVAMRRSRGENLGYQVIAHKTDGSSAPITNSDVDRIEQWALENA